MNTQGDRNEEGELYCRRYSEHCWSRIVPIGMSLGVILFGWGVSVETRIGNMATVQQERAPVIANLRSDIADLYNLVRDPAPRPQAKVMLDQIMGEHKVHEDRINRLEERFNNFHQFLLQTRQLVVPPSKKGSLPFKPEGNEG